jgi:hypothetical protein
MTASGDRRSSGADRSAKRDYLRSEEVETAHHDLAAEQGARDGLAPYAKYEGPARVEGVYIVRLRKGADPVAMAARVGVGTRDVWDRLPGFCAELTDAELDLVRRDPDTEFIEDNVRGTTI